MEIETAITTETIKTPSRTKFQNMKNDNLKSND